jgi:hypothetical protein
MARSPVELELENDCWRGPAAIVNDRPILSTEGYDRNGSVEKKL